MKKYAISDIHGHLKTFNLLLDTIGFTPKDELYILGDMVDRGLYSKEVLDKLMEMQQSGLKVFCLMGNHEKMFLNAIENPIDRVYWIKYGGAQTAISFGLDFGNFSVPERYVHFLRNLPTHFEVDDYILTHAGLNFKSDDPLSDTEAMLWIRDWHDSVDADFLGDRIIVHGHSPRKRDFILNQLENIDSDQVLDIDNGCCYNHPGFNHLCAFNMTDKEVVFVKNVG